MARISLQVSREVTVRSFHHRELLVLPNLLSAARVPLALAFAAARDRESQVALIAGAGLTDLLDGWSARRLGQVSEAGAAIDGFADKIFGGTLLVTLVLRGVLSPASALLLATRELLELPLAIRVLVSPAAREAAVDRSANRLGKVATALELAAIVSAIGRSRFTNVLVGAAGIAGALAGISYWMRELRAERALVEPAAPEDRPVPYLLAGGSPERLAALAA